MSRDKIKWWGFLKSSDRPDGEHKKALLDVVEPTTKSLIVCQEIKTRSFTHFSTYFDFAMYVKREVREVNRCFFELIFGVLGQKIYFDCECVRKEEPGVPLEAAFKIEGVPRLPARVDGSNSQDGKPIRKQAPKFALSEAEADAGVLQLRDIILKLCPQLSVDDIMVFSSHGTAKLSYHLIVDNWCLPNSDENRAFHDACMALLPEKYRPLVDHGMYKSIQQLRTYLSHKFESNRTKTLSHLSTWKPLVPHESEDHAFVQILGASLVSNVSYCKLLPSFAPPPLPKPAFDGDAIQLSTEEIDAALELGSKYSAGGGSKGDENVMTDGDFPFKLEEVRGGMLLLKRLAPSWCKLCKRTHETENPFVIVTGGPRNVYFYCRRAENNGRQLMGSLGRKAIEQVEYSKPSFLDDVLPLPVESVEVDISVSVRPVRRHPSDKAVPMQRTQSVPTRLSELTPLSATKGLNAAPSTPPGFTSPSKLGVVPLLPGVTGVGLAIQMQMLPSTPRSAPRIDKINVSINTPKMFNMKFDLQRFYR